MGTINLNHPCKCQATSQSATFRTTCDLHGTCDPARRNPRTCDAIVVSEHEFTNSRKLRSSCNFSAGTCKLAGTCNHINFLAGTCKLAGTCDPKTTSWQEPAYLLEPAIPQQLPGRNLQTRGNLLSHSTFPAGTCKLAGTCNHTEDSQQEPANSQEPAITQHIPSSGRVRSGRERSGKERSGRECSGRERSLIM